jgi:hypothetical protein
MHKKKKLHFLLLGLSCLILVYGVNLMTIKSSHYNQESNENAALTGSHLSAQFNDTGKANSSVEVPFQANSQNRKPAHEKKISKQENDNDDLEKQEAGPTPEANRQDNKGISADPLFWIGVGTGVSYTSLAQSGTGATNLFFSDFGEPSYSLRGGFWIVPEWGADLGYKDTPGEAKSSTNLSLSGGTFRRRSMSLVALWRPVPRRVIKNQWIWRFGLQQNRDPLLIPTSSSTIELQENDFTYATLGFEYRKPLRDKLRFEWLTQYQHLLAAASSESNLSFKPIFAIDGSIGAVYGFSERFNLGLYWHGQWQNLSFDYRRVDQNLSFTGELSLFYSSIDLRIRIEF